MCLVPALWMAVRDDRVALPGLLTSIALLATHPCRRLVAKICLIVEEPINQHHPGGEVVGAAPYLSSCAAGGAVLRLRSTLAACAMQSYAAAAVEYTFAFSFWRNHSFKILSSPDSVGSVDSLAAAAAYGEIANLSMPEQRDVAESDGDI